MPARIALVSGSFPPILDGVGDYTKVLLEHLSERCGSEQVELVTTATPGLDRRTGRITRTLPHWGVGPVWRLARYLTARKPEIVNLQFPTVGYGRKMAPTLLPWLLRIFLPQTRIVATLHEFASRTVKGKLRIAATLSGCHDVITVCEHYGQEVLSFCPRLRCRFHYVPIGCTVLPQPVDGGHVAQVRRSLAIGEQAPVLIHFGVIREGKALELLLRAFRALRDALPDAVLLVVGGRDPHYDQTVFQPLLEQLAITPHVRLLGHCTETELSRYFAAADAGVQPFPDGVSTRRSSFLAPLVHGLPIVTTRPVQPFPELRDGEHALLVAPGDVGALTQAMIQLCLRPELRARLRGRARQLAAVFGWDRVVDRTLAVFEDSLSRRPPARRRTASEPVTARA